MDLQVQTGTHELVVCPAVDPSSHSGVKDIRDMLVDDDVIYHVLLLRAMVLPRTFVYVFVLEQGIGD